MPAEQALYAIAASLGSLAHESAQVRSGLTFFRACLTASLVIAAFTYACPIYWTCGRWYSETNGLVVGVYLSACCSAAIYLATGDLVRQTGVVPVGLFVLLFVTMLGSDVKRRAKMSSATQDGVYVAMTTGFVVVYPAVALANSQALAQLGRSAREPS